MEKGIHPLRISLITSVFLPEAGGSPIAVFNRCVSLSKFGHKVQLLIPDYGNKTDKKVINKLQGLGVQIVLLPTKISHYVPMGIVPSSQSNKVINPKVLEFRPDILLVDEPMGFRIMSNLSLDISFFKKAGIFTCAIVHANASGVLKQLRKHFLAFIMKRLSKKEFDRYDLTLFSTSYLQNIYDSLENGKIVKHLGVDKDIFRFTSHAKRKSTDILYFGRIAPEKNLSFLFEAAQSYTNKFPDSKWYFVGDGPELEYWMEKQTEGIRFVGAKKHGIELYEYLKNADVFVSACEIEAYGLTIVEAMSSGLTVLVPDKGAAPLHFKDGESGFSFKTGDMNDFLSKLERVTHDAELRISVGEKASAIPITWEEGTKNLVNSCIEEIVNKEKGNLYSRLMDDRSVGSIELRIESIMNEYKEAVNEIQQYQKNILQNLYISLIFMGVVIGIGSAGNPWVIIYPAMQILLILFLFIGYKLDEDMIIDSAYVVSIEERVNILLGQKLLGWQDTIGVMQHTNGQKDDSVSYQVSTIMIGIIYFGFYLIICFLCSNTIANLVYRNLYLLISITTYIFLFLLLINSKRKAVNDALLKIYRDKCLFLAKL